MSAITFDQISATTTLIESEIKNMSLKEDLKSIREDMEHNIIDIHRLCDKIANVLETEDLDENNDVKIAHIARMLDAFSMSFAWHAKRKSLFYGMTDSILNASRRMEELSENLCLVSTQQKRELLSAIEQKLKTHVAMIPSWRESKLFS